MIIHTAVFKTKYEDESQELTQFLAFARQLEQIPGVEHFDILPQVSKKSDYQYALYMEFEDQESYDFYNDHPTHVAFVKDQWIPRVVDFIELDYIKSEE